MRLTYIEFDEKYIDLIAEQEVMKKSSHKKLPIFRAGLISWPLIQDLF